MTLEMLIKRALSPKYYLYFSFWNLLMVIFHKYTHKHYNLLLSCLIVSAISFIIAYISPQYFQVETHDPKDSYVVQGWALKLGDLFTHHLPLTFVAIVYGSYYLSKNDKYQYHTAVALLVTTLYTLCMNPIGLYDLDPRHLVIAFVGAILVYVYLPSR